MWHRPGNHHAHLPDLGYRRAVTDYRTLNRANWDERAPAHAASADYEVGAFAADPAHLSGVVRFDRPLLGDVKGLRGVHLQCHIGTDTVSLARLGATMTGVDFSPASLEQARRVSAQAGNPVEFVESDVYDAVDRLGEGGFDLVYTGIGALCWLPDIRRWAGVVAGLLRPGGRLFIREGHPVLWSLADPLPEGGALTLEYPYFEHPEPLVWSEGGTYVETAVEFTHNTTHEWNHGLGEIVTALIDAGMAVTGLIEHDSIPWDAFPGHMRRVGDGEWRLADRPERLPHSYTLQAIRTAV
jgi:SAM-dependent methyltransferase